MKSANNFSKNREKLNDDLFWKILPIKMLGGLKIQIVDDKYNISDYFQSFFADTADKIDKKVYE